MMWSCGRSPHVRGSFSARHVVLLGLAGAVLAGCGHPQTASATSVVADTSRQAAAEAAPSMPAGWQTFEDDTGSLRVTLPPDLIRIEGFSGVSAQLATEPPTFALEVHASAAHIQPPKPWTERTVQAWLLEQLGGLVGADHVTQVETSVVELPAGEALQVRTQFRPGGPDVIEIVGYAIPSANGLVDLHILALPEYWQMRRHDLELIPRLLELGE